MARLHESIVVPVSTEVAFDYVARFETTAEWDPGIREARALFEGLPEVGSEFELTSVFAGQESVLRYVIRVLDRPHELVIEGMGDKVHAVDTIRFSPAGSGTRIDYTASISLKGFASLAEPLLYPLLVRMGRKAVAGLKRTLEGGAGGRSAKAS
ncbi:MAG: SRPBCC family protein [Deltaproteobacteria bacterium]|nr:SRPBCC family protein [Deltaproteobacteria bacterium]